MKRPLSTFSRTEIIEDLESTTFDLLVIGGGITGAGIAWDAAKRGIKTALIERNDFSSGTSSRSTKLIHGGLRYLKKGEVRLVRQVGQEREWLYRSAPHLVIPMPMLLPIYKGGTYGYWSASLGLFIYDRLAGVDKAERRIMQGPEETKWQEPLLTGAGLKGAGLYYEYRSDDSRLTVEVLKTAVRHGAWAVNYVEATDFQYYKSKVCGIKAVDRLTGTELEIRAKRVVNAAGPWVDEVRSRDHALKGKTLLLTKGVHLVVDHSKLPVKQAVYFDTADGRMVFVIPREGKTYIGTTDTVYTGDPGKLRATTGDRDYLLQAVDRVFPHMALTPNDVESMWAGLRPLIREEGKNPSDISRRDEIWESSSGLITIAGGKLTGFRKMAESVVDLIGRSLERESRNAFGPCTTSGETLSGGDSGRCETYGELKEQLLNLGIKKGLTREHAQYLLSLYGSNTAEIYMRMEGLDSRFEDWTAEEQGQEPDESDGREAGDRELGASVGREAGDREFGASVGREAGDGELGASVGREADDREFGASDGREADDRASGGSGYADRNQDSMKRRKHGWLGGRTEEDLRDVEQWKPGIFNSPQEEKVAEAWRLLEELSGRSEASWRKRNQPSSVQAETKSDRQLPRNKDSVLKRDKEELGPELETDLPNGQGVETVEAQEAVAGAQDAVEAQDAAGAQDTVIGAQDAVKEPVVEREQLKAATAARHGTSVAEDEAEENEETDEAQQYGDEDDEAPLDHNEYRALEAEIRYCIEEEMTVHAADFLVRRTGLLYFNRERAERIAIYVVEIMAQQLGWDEAETMKQKLQLAAEWEAATVAVKSDLD
ncbi:MAG: dependent oxidoreductase [Paenibacillaceae bacterium]|jgi:glycerol-3-phosphate dehydrogenase|nr:dependent oxidoreductase [Paenibacillaceae bacterium]